MKHLAKSPTIFAALLLFLTILAACRTNNPASSADAGQPPSTPDQGSGTTAVPTKQATATSAPTETAVPTDPPPTATSTATKPPTSTPSPVPPPTQTETPPPTETPAPTPTATIEPVPQPEWLIFLNRFREMAGLSPVAEWEPYSAGSEIHSHYMVANDDPIAHTEDPNKPFYDPAGDQAAQNGNLFATSQTEADYVWSMNFWASAPFHLIDILKPNLNKVGYGDYVEAGGDVAMAGVLDIGSDPGEDHGTEYPVLFPSPDSRTWVVRHSLFEWPDAMPGCPGFSRPTGAPIVLLLGDGTFIPQVEDYDLAQGETSLEVCVFDETTYQNPDPYAAHAGIEILQRNNAVVIMPRHPLAADETYTVKVSANGETHTWQFHTIKRPD